MAVMHDLPPAEGKPEATRSDGLPAGYAGPFQRRHPTESFEVGDLFDFPDDGRRYELVFGSLLVSPAPAIVHQLVIQRLLVALLGVAPEELEVIEGCNLRRGATRC